MCSLPGPPHPLAALYKGATCPLEAGLSSVPSPRNLLSANVMICDNVVALEQDKLPNKMLPQPHAQDSYLG